MPLLEFLILDGLCPSATPSPYGTELVVLSYITHMFVSWPRTACARIIQHIKAPPLGLLDIHCGESSDEGVSSFKDLFVSLAFHTARGTEPILTLLIRHDETDCFEIRGWPRSTSNPLGPDWCYPMASKTRYGRVEDKQGPTLRLRMDWARSSEWSTVHVLRLLFPSINIRDLQTLQLDSNVSYNRNWTKQFFVVIFVCMENLERLSIVDSSAAALAATQALALKLSLSSSPGPHSPALERSWTSANISLAPAFSLN